MTEKVPPAGAADDPSAGSRDPVPTVDELTQQVMTWIAMSMRLTRGRPMTESLELLNELGLTLPQIVALHVIAFEGTTTMTRLVERIGLSTSAVSHLLHRLVHMGLCERQDDPFDRRQRRVRLTPEGQDVVKKLMKSRTADTRASIEPLSPTTRVLLGEALTSINTELVNTITQLEQEEQKKAPASSSSSSAAEPDLEELLQRLEEIGDDVAEAASTMGDRLAETLNARVEQAMERMQERLEHALEHHPHRNRKQKKEKS